MKKSDVKKLIKGLVKEIIQEYDIPYERRLFDGMHDKTSGIIEAMKRMDLDPGKSSKIRDNIKKIQKISDELEKMF